MFSVVLVGACPNPLPAAPLDLKPATAPASSLAAASSCGQPAWAGGFGLPGVDGKKHSLADLKDALQGALAATKGGKTSILNVHVTR